MERLKTLKGFQRVNVAAGKTTQTIVNLPSASFEFYDRPSGKMVVATGEYEVLYGCSSMQKT